MGLVWPTITIYMYKIKKELKKITGENQTWTIVENPLWKILNDFGFYGSRMSFKKCPIADFAFHSAIQNQVGMLEYGFYVIFDMMSQ